MEINLTPAQSEILRQAMAAGHVQDLDEAVQQAMAQWIERQRRRAEFIQSLDEARASVARGEGITIRNEADRQQLVADISKRGRARLEAAKSALTNGV